MEGEDFWALGACLTNAETAKQLVAHLRLPSGKLPEFYEVVVKAQFLSRTPIRIDYVTHRNLSLLSE